MFVYYKKINDDYGEIISVCSIKDDLNVGLYINTNVWPTDINGVNVNKDACVVDITNLAVILYPTPLKIEVYKQKKLDELAKRFINNGNEMSIGEQTLAKIVTDIKNSSSTAEVDEAFEQIKKEKNKFLKRIGLSS